MMQPQEIIRSIELYTGKFPREALEAAIAEPESVTPELLNVLKHVINNVDNVWENSDYMAHMFAMYLLAQFREQQAYPLFIQLVSLPAETVDKLLEDIITEGLDRMLASVYDGDIEPIQSIIENEEVNEWVRSAALRTLIILVAQDVLSRDEVMNYFMILFDGKIPHTLENNIILAELVEVCCLLYPEEVYANIELLFAKDLLDPFIIKKNFVDGYMSRDKATVLSELKTARTVYPREYIKDTISELEDWAAFKPQQPIKKKPIAPVTDGRVVRDVPVVSGASVMSGDPVVRQERKIGRNEPCPCGSGLKYKRCCGKRTA